MLKAGLVGAGHLGKIHLKLLNQSDRYEFVGFHDKDVENGKKLEAEFGYKYFENFDDLLTLCQIMEEEKNMSFLQHLEELRWRLVRCAAVILVLAVVIWWNQDWIMQHVFLSMSKADFFTFDFFCRYLNFMCVEEIPVNFQSTTMGGQFSYALWMSFLGGIVVGFPFIFYQLWSFVKPGLKQNEKKMVKGIVLYVSLLFFLGILFGYFIFEC